MVADGTIREIVDLGDGRKEVIEVDVAFADAVGKEVVQCAKPILGRAKFINIYRACFDAQGKASTIVVKPDAFPARFDDGIPEFFR